ERAERVDVVRVLSSYGEAMVTADGMRRERAHTVQAAELREEQARLRDFIDAAGRAHVPVEPVCVEGRPGVAVAAYAREHRADLLVMPSSAGFGHFFERLIPSDME